MALIIHNFFVAYTFLLFARIIISWFPDWYRYHIVRFICFYTDPYLDLFRKILPPIGGVLDISPILAFFALQLFEKIIMGLIL